MFEETRALAVPILVITLSCVAVELLISLKRDLKLYQLKDTLCNLFILIVNRLSQPLLLGYTYAALTMVEGLRPNVLPADVLWTVIALLLTDFAYYWEHRVSHTFKPLWLLHEVHHSSKQFNFSTSFRLPWLGRLIGPVIFTPLILIGFRAEQILLFFIVNLFYQFFLHTKLIGKLGPLEGVFNTPSAHRVHHASNPEYIDKNFGGILMVWDRLFGTYAAETVSPVFGVKGTFESNNPFTVQFHKFPFYSQAANAVKSLPIVSSLIAVSLMVSMSTSTSAQTNDLVPATTSTSILAPTKDSIPTTTSTSISAQTTAATSLKGAIEFSDTKLPDYTGTWKGHVLEYHRHPRVEITEQTGNQMRGTYSGLLGKFPLTGTLDQINQSVQFNVDFSKSKLARWKRRETVVAVFYGSITEGKISGTASIPEFGNRTVHFEANKVVKVGETKSTTNQSLQ